MYELVMFLLNLKPISSLLRLTETSGRADGLIERSTDGQARKRIDWWTGGCAGRQTCLNRFTIWNWLRICAVYKVSRAWLYFYTLVLVEEIDLKVLKGICASLRPSALNDFCFLFLVLFIENTAGITCNDLHINVAYYKLFIQSSKTRL